MLSTIISALIALGTTLATLHFTHKNDVKKWVLEKRAEIYFEYYDQVEEVLINKNTIFDTDYRDSLSKMKPQMKLIASDDTFKAFKEYYEFVCDTVRDYEKYRDTNDPEKDLSWLEENIDDNGERQGQMYKNMEIFEFKMDEYKEKKLQDIDSEIDQKIETLYQAMRDDLGSNLKR